jgi:hypothetical protein
MRAPKSRWMLLATAMVMVAALEAATPVEAMAEDLDNCVVKLVPVSEDPAPGPIDAIMVDLGCYATYAEAVEVGTGGGTSLPASTTPAAATQRLIERESDVDVGSVMIGTEYTETLFEGRSKSYFASESCSSGVIWEVSYVTDAWNDDFESGKGFGGCDTNKKFKASNFGGEVLTCTPNCSNYGTLKNEVSSLRWRP